MVIAVCATVGGCTYVPPVWDATDKVNFVDSIEAKSLQAGDQILFSESTRTILMAPMTLREFASLFSFVIGAPQKH